MGDNILDIDIDFEDLGFEDVKTPAKKMARIKRTATELKPNSTASKPAKANQKRVSALKLSGVGGGSPQPKMNDVISIRRPKTAQNKTETRTTAKLEIEPEPRTIQSDKSEALSLSVRRATSGGKKDASPKPSKKLTDLLSGPADDEPKFHHKPKKRAKAQTSNNISPSEPTVTKLKLEPEQKSEPDAKPQQTERPKPSTQFQGYSYGQLNHLCNLVRQDILDMLYHAKSGHSAGSLDQVEIFVALYFKIMRHDPSDPTWAERDILVQSNGHTVPVRYAVMARAGYFPRHNLLSLRQFNSDLQGHPERERIPALETTSGPLGSGLSQAAGMALSLNMDGNVTRRVYCTMGDGELNEGNIWEAAMFAAKYKLGNLIGIVDRNNIQIDGKAEDIMPLEDLRLKWEAFGWYVQEVDGNNIESVVTALSLAKSQTAKPNLIIAHTIPGKGVDFMEYDPAWHGKAPNHQQELDAIRKLRTLDNKIEGGHL